MKQSRIISSVGRPSGFTLIELMIAIGLSLLLVAGINAIFRTTANTVSVSQATLSANRDLRNVLDGLDADIGGFMPPESQPLLLIYGQCLPGFRDATDMKADRDYLATQTFENALHVFDAQGVLVPTPRVGGANAASVYSDNRNHRVDILSFFSSATFRRMTGQQNDAGRAVYQSEYGSGTAYIHYGHARLPDGTNTNWGIPSTYRPPGLTAVAGAPQNSSSTSNPNGFFSNQWVLARNAVLLGTPDAGNKIFAGGFPQAYATAQLPPGPKPQDMLRPFGYGTPITYDGVNAIPGVPNQIQDSTCDLAGISAEAFATRVQDWAVIPPPLPPTAVKPARNPAWYYPLLSAVPVGATATPEQTFRFACKPWVTRSNTNSQVMRTDFALSSPTFIRGCSQFIVEFAGDYLEQNPPANQVPDRVTGQRSDGILDFDAIRIPGPGAATYQKRIRWYGLNRRYADNPNPGALDVMSVYSFAQQDLGAAARVLPFEKIVNNTDSFPYLANPPGTLGTVASYTCAWSPHDFQWPNGTVISSPGITPPTLASSSLNAKDDPKFDGTDPGAIKVVAGVGYAAPVTLPVAYPHGFMPWMIRITLRIDDPNGRLEDGQTIQYVFNLPHK